MAVLQRAASADSKSSRFAGQTQIPRARSTGMFSTNLQELPAGESGKDQHSRWVLDVRAWLLPLRKPTSPEVIPWSHQVPSREPCYLVELLDQAWFERNVLEPRKCRTATQRLPPITEGEVRRLLQQDRVLPGRRVGSPTDERHVAAGGEERGVRGRALSYRPGADQQRRSSSVDVVPQGRGGAKEGDDGPHAFPRGRSMSINSASLAKRRAMNASSHLQPPLRGRSLTATDLEELQGFMDLGFNFSRDATSPQMSAALPALKLYHAVESVQNRLISNHKLPAVKAPSLQQPFIRGLPLDTLSEALTEIVVRPSDLSPPEPWMVPTPEDNPADVKMYLRMWARTVATAVRQVC